MRKGLTMKDLQDALKALDKAVSPEVWVSHEDLNNIYESSGHEIFIDWVNRMNIITSKAGRQFIESKLKGL